MSKKITISAGHWSVLNSGASGILNEVTEARKVVNKVVSILKDSGINVVKVEDNQSKNQASNLNYLIGQHKKQNGDLNISVHFNASGGTVERGIGTEVLYYVSNMKAYATVMSAVMANSGGFTNRGAKYRNNLGFLLNLRNALLLEVCFVNSKTDAVLYNKNFDKICYSIAKQLAALIGEKLKEAKPTQPKDYSKSIGENIPAGSTTYRIHTNAFTSQAEADKATVAYVKSGHLRYAECFGNDADKYRIQSGKYTSHAEVRKVAEKIIDDELRSYVSIIGFPK